ncbi:MAG: hypothetical protein AAGA77_15340, partial [Bacteroidota bacterium]
EKNKPQMKIVLPYLFLLLVTLCLSTCKTSKNIAFISLQDFQGILNEAAAQSDSRKAGALLSMHKQIFIKSDEIKGIQRNIGKRLIRNKELSLPYKKTYYQPQEHCFYDTIYCNGTIFSTLVERCVNINAGATHSVTGEIPVGGLKVLSESDQSLPCTKNECISIDKNNMRTYIGLSLTIKIPCDGHNNMGTNNSGNIGCRIKLFGKENIPINDLQIQYLNGNAQYTNGPFNHTLTANSFPIDLLNQSYQCGNDCFVRANIFFSFIPHIKDENACRPFLHHLALQLEDVDAIEHNDYHHNANSNKTNISLPAADLVMEKTLIQNVHRLEKFNVNTNIRVSQICSTNPNSLNDFVICNRSDICGHRAAHTLVLEIPFCSEDTNQLLYEPNFF